MPTDQEIAEQERLLAAHRQTLYSYLHQQAMHGVAGAPPVVTNGITSSRSEIRRIKEILRGWGEQIDDHPNDEASPESEGTLPTPPAITPNGITSLGKWSPKILVLILFVIVAVAVALVAFNNLGAANQRQRNLESTITALESRIPSAAPNGLALAPTTALVVNVATDAPATARPEPTAVPIPPTDPPATLQPTITPKPTPTAVPPTEIPIPSFSEGEIFKKNGLAIQVTVKERRSDLIILWWIFTNTSGHDIPLKFRADTNMPAKDNPGNLLKFDNYQCSNYFWCDGQDMILAAGKTQRDTITYRVSLTDEKVYPITVTWLGSDFTPEAKWVIQTSFS